MARTVRRHPEVGVGAVVIQQGRVLLIRRGKEPLRGRWTVPGGTVEWGETLEQALVREIEEETGLVVEPGEVLLVFDRIDGQGEDVQHHYVIVDYLCQVVGGTLRAGSDAEAAEFVSPADFSAHDLPPATLDVVRRGLRLCGLLREETRVASPS